MAQVLGYWNVKVSHLTGTGGLRRVLAGLKRWQYLQAGGHNLILRGGYGTGKTQAAVLILKYALQRGCTGRFVNLGMLAAEVRDGYGATAGEGLTERAAVGLMGKPDLLILDDLGAGETSTAVVEKRLLYLSLEQRCNNRRMTVITTNLPLERMAKIYGHRILNRLEPSSTIEFEGQNFRLEQQSGGGW